MGGTTQHWHDLSRTQFSDLRHITQQELVSLRQNIIQLAMCCYSSVEIAVMCSCWLDLTSSLLRHMADTSGWFLRSAWEILCEEANCRGCLNNLSFCLLSDKSFIFHFLSDCGSCWQLMCWSFMMMLIRFHVDAVLLIT